MNFIPGLLPRKAADRRFLKAGTLASADYVTPATIDSRSQLLGSSDQGTTSMCVAYAIAGWIEFYRWKHLGIAKQVDPESIYREAKRIDGEPKLAGTTLEAGLRAAQLLGLIDPVDEASIHEVVNPLDVQQAIHRYGVVLSAFQITDQWLFANKGGWIPDGGREIGGHSVLLCGYNKVDSLPWYSLQNSWGDGQGWRGFNRVTQSQLGQQFNYGLVWGKSL